MLIPLRGIPFLGRAQSSIAEPERQHPRSRCAFHRPPGAAVCRRCPCDPRPRCRSRIRGPDACTAEASRRADPPEPRRSAPARASRSLPAASRAPVDISPRPAHLPRRHVHRLAGHNAGPIADLSAQDASLARKPAGLRSLRRVSILAHGKSKDAHALLDAVEIGDSVPGGQPQGVVRFQHRPGGQAIIVIPIQRLGPIEDRVRQTSLPHKGHQQPRLLAEVRERLREHQQSRIGEIHAIDDTFDCHSGNVGAGGRHHVGNRKAPVGALEKCAGEDLNLQALTGTTTSK